MGQVFRCQGLKGTTAWEWTWWHDNGKIAATASWGAVKYFGKDGEEGGDFPTSFRNVVDPDLKDNIPLLAGQISKRLHSIRNRWEVCHARSVEKGPEHWWFGKIRANLALAPNGRLTLASIEAPTVDLEFRRCLDGRLPNVQLPDSAQADELTTTTAAVATIEIEFFAPVSLRAEAIPH